MDQYEAARDSVWRGASRLSSLSKFKSVYSISFRVCDQFTRARCPDLPGRFRGNGYRERQTLWQANQEFWKAHPTPLEQEIIFASTGTKDPSDRLGNMSRRWRGSDIQTNPPETNDAVAKSGQVFTRQVDQMPPAAVLQELDSKVDGQALYARAHARRYRIVCHAAKEN